MTPTEIAKLTIRHIPVMGLYQANIRTETEVDAWLLFDGMQLVDVWVDVKACDGGRDSSQGSTPLD